MIFFINWEAISISDFAQKMEEEVEVGITWEAISIPVFARIRKVNMRVLNGSLTSSQTTLWKEIIYAKGI